MDKVIIYTRKDGGVSILRPTKEQRELFDSDEQCLQDSIDKSIPNDASDVMIVSKDSLISDRTFRNAFKIDTKNNKIVHDMDKAKDLLKEDLRHKRVPLLNELDVQFLKAVELDDEKKKAKVVVNKKKLRDVTEDKRITKAEDVEELKKLLFEGIHYDFKD